MEWIHSLINRIEWFFFSPLLVVIFLFFVFVFQNDAVVFKCLINMTKKKSVYWFTQWSEEILILYIYEDLNMVNSANWFVKF